MVVEYFHGDRFQWGYNLTDGQINQFGGIGFDPGNPIESLSFTYNFVDKLADSFKFNLSVLANEERARIVTNPHISVRNGETGSIKLAEELHVTLSNPSSAFGSVLTLEQLTAGVELSITPQIAGKDLIILDVTGEVAVFIDSAEGEFAIDRNTVTSKVNLRADETLILGGLIKEVINNSESGVPGLRSIPVLGYLFKSQLKERQYIESVIYITPHTTRDNFFQAEQSRRRVREALDALEGPEDRIDAEER